jgi:orotidine-5'-phosphate decarboxylase
MNPANRLMVALDVDEISQAEVLTKQLAGLGVTFKIGNQLGTYEGWAKAVKFAHDSGSAVFCDTKFKDIPATVEKSARAITRLQPEFFTVMADTNSAALEAAVRGAGSAMRDFRLQTRPKILGVTVLTSLSDAETRQIYGKNSQAKVLQFAETAAKAGLDGVVCSAQEAKMLRGQEATKNLLLVVPGIRPNWALSGDQARTMTASEAIKNGADYLVIGRPITQPTPEIGSPRDAVLKIIDEIN